jgi:hypothetical protein
MGQPGQSEQLAPPPIHKNLPKKSEALQYCDSNEFIETNGGCITRRTPSDIGAEQGKDWKGLKTHYGNSGVM